MHIVFQFMLLGVMSAVSADPGIKPSTRDDTKTVSLEIQFNDGKKLRIEKIPFKTNMTILDVMQYAKKNKKLKFQFRGKSDTAFLTSINGIKNKGASGDNWIFRVNKKLGRKSFGITKLNADDEVTWTFGKYKP